MHRAFSLSLPLAFLASAVAALVASRGFVERSWQPRPAGADPLACRRVEPLAAIDGFAPEVLVKGDVFCFGGLLAAGQVLDLRAQQLGVDLVLHAFGGDGVQLMRVDHPIGPRGIEPLVLAPEGSSQVLLKVEVAEVREEPRSAALELRAFGTARVEHRQLARAVADLAEAEELRRTGLPENLTRALALYPPAEATFRSLGETDLQQRSVRQETSTALKLGDLLYDGALFTEAEGAYRQALGAARRAGEELLAARAENGLGLSFAAQGRLREAEAAYGHARTLYHRAGQPVDAARVGANLGTLLLESGAAREALAQYRAVRATLPATAAAAEHAELERKIGWALLELDRFDEAEQLFRTALERASHEAEPLLEGSARSGLARTHYERGNLEAAEAEFECAAELFALAGDRPGEAMAHHNAAWSRVRRGRFEEALPLFDRALAPMREAKHERMMAAIEAGRAVALRGLSRFEEAAAAARRALDRSEELRAGTDRLDLRRSLLAGRLDLADLAADLAVTLAGKTPENTWLEQGFEFSERAKGRSLLDAIALPAAARPDRRQLEERVSRAGSEAERELALGALRASERIAVEGRGEPRSLAALRTALTDRETVLLSFDLGEERSLLWLVSADTVHAVRLPPRAEVEELAARAARLIAAGEEREPWRTPTLQALARTLFGEVMPRLGARRWWVVPDGALWALPFDALPDLETGEPLVGTHEITLTPSASIAAQLLAREAARPRAPHLLALLADPAFAPGIERLPASAREAAGLITLVPEVDRVVALGSAANERWVLGGALRDRRLLHFATHGRLDATHPELSGLDLAAPPPGAEPGEAFLAAHEVASLDLDAELAVLAACETALGAPVPGEGLVGLPQAFLRAGASRVLVSLWKVRDRAAAALMEHFYQGYLVEGLPASTALHRAKRALAREPAFAKPRDWAAFVLHGAR